MTEGNDSVTTGSTANETLLRGQVTPGPVILGENGERCETLHITTGFDPVRFIRCFADDVVEDTTDPEGFGSVVRVRSTATLEYVTRVPVTTDDLDDLVTGAIAQRHHGCQTYEVELVARSPKPCSRGSL